MKRILVAAAAFCSVLTGFGQLAAPVNDSVSMGATYLNDVYYDLSSGDQSEQATNNWHIAFRTGGPTDGIRVNSATATGANDGSTDIYVWPDGVIADWANLDTTGYMNWESFENDETTWEVGALNQSSTGFPDVSWGTYNMTTHVVTGDSVYLLVYQYQGATHMRKLYINKKEASNWTFTIAEVDGSNEQTVELKTADYAGDTYIYYNAETFTALDREPAAWDFVLTRYNTEAAPGTFVATTGVLTNSGIISVKAEGEPTDDIEFDTYKADSTDAINEIGYDWKYYVINMGVTWEVRDSLAYFIKDRSDIWFKLVWTGFGGSNNGKATFTKTQLTTGVGITGPESVMKSSALYPNPASDKVTLLTELVQGAEGQVAIHDAQGKVVKQMNLAFNEGINQNTLTVSDLERGVYFLQVVAGNSTQTIRFIKR